MRTLLLTFCCIFSMAVAVTSHSGNPCTPGKVEVLPVFFVPEGGVAPTEDQKDDLTEHLIWSQTRYYEMLMERSTFTISEKGPVVFNGDKPDDYYKAEDQGGTYVNDAGIYVNELLNHFNYTRFDCPYVFVVIYMNPDPASSFPTEGGRPINAGFNTGGGIVILSSNALNESPNFQSTLQRALGNCFGLPFVNTYGYDVETNASIMSRNPNHHTDGFNPSATPGILIPEDIRGLALNDLVFSKLFFDPATDVPGAYTFHPYVVTLGVLPIPGHPHYNITVTGNYDAAFNTRHANLVQGEIRPNGIQTSPITVTFHAATMWVSSLMPEDELIVLDFVFPITVTLDKISLHSQHSGFIHPADSIIIQVLDNGDYKTLVDQPVSLADEWYGFEASTSNTWRVYLKAGETNYVTLRGLQFYYMDNDVFPPFIPYGRVTYPYDHTPPTAQLPSRPEPYMPMNHETLSQMNVDLGWSGQRADEYILQVDSTTRFCDPIVNTVLQSESFQFAAPDYNKTYYWRVKGLNDVANGFGLWSALFEFEIDDTPSRIQDISANSITVYPNPSSGSFSISSKEIISEIHIIDMLGRNVFSAKPNQTQISCSLDRTGVYVIHLTTLNGVRTQKLIINNK